MTLAFNVLSRRAALAAGLAAGASLALSALPAAAQQKPPIRVGSLLPLTGPNAGVAFSVSTGWDMAIRDINAAGGIDGRQIVQLKADDQTDPTVGVSEAKWLITQEKIEVLLGPANSQLSIALAPILNDAKIASTALSGSALLTPTLSRYQFSSFPSMEAQGEAVFNHVLKVMKVKSAAILADDGAASKTFIETTKAFLEKNGIQVTGIQQWTLGSTDMSPQILSLRRGNPDVVLLNSGTSADAGYVVKSALELNWTVPIAGSLTIGNNTRQIGEIAGQNAFKNMVALSFLTASFCASDAVGSSQYAQFLLKLKAFAPEKYDRLGYDLAATAYDQVYLLKAAVEGAKSTDGVAVAKWIEENAGKVKTVGPGFSASATNHFVLGPDTMTMVENANTIRSDGLRKRHGC